MTRVAIRGLVARPVRTALTLLAIVIGVAFVSAAYTFTDTMRGAADSLSSAAYDGTDAVVSTRTAFEPGSESLAEVPPLAAGTVADVRAVPQVGVAAGEVLDEAQLIDREGEPLGDGPYFASGLDAGTPGVTDLTPFRLHDGRWAAGAGEVVIDQQSAENGDYAVGDRITVATRGEASAYRVVGVATFADVKSIGTATLAVFDLRTAQELFGKTGRIDRVLAAGRPGTDPAAVRGAVAGAAGPDARVQTAAADDRYQLDVLQTISDVFRTILLAFAGIAIVVGAFTIFNTLSITVAQRSREFGLMRMVGATRRQVRRSVMVEALLTGLVASVVGVVAGFGLAKGIGALFEATGMSLPKAGTVLEARTVIVSLLVGTVVTLVAGMIPALRATRIPPVAAMRAAGEGTSRRGPLTWLARGLASLIGRPVERLGGSAGRLARRNAMRQPGRTAATASALLIGVALVTAVTVVGQGLRDSSTGSIERRVQATHVVTGVDGWTPIDQQVERAAAQAPGVSGVTSLRQDSALAFGDEEIVNAVDPATIGGLFAFDVVKGGTDLGRDGALVDEGWASEHGLALGERFSVTSAEGEKVSLVVRGIEESPVLDILSLGPVTMSQAAFDGAFAQDRNRFTLVKLDGGQASLDKALAGYPDAKVLTKQGYIDDQTEFVSQLLAVLWVLLALAVIVSLFGIVNTLVLSTLERTREIGTLRAVGMSRRQIRRMVRQESVITALMGALPGIGIGLGLAGLAVAALGKYGVTFAVPTGALIAVAVVAIVAGMAAAVLPARRAARTDVLSALAYE